MEEPATSSQRRQQSSVDRSSSTPSEMAAAVTGDMEHVWRSSVSVVEEEEQEGSTRLGSKVEVFLPSVRKMSKRIGDSSSSNKRKKARKSRKMTRNLLDDGSLSESSQGTLSELNQEVVSKLSETVVSLASFNGDQVHAVCTGTVVKNDGYGTSILTAASLVRSFNIDDGCKIIPTLRIEVDLPNKQSDIGWLVHYDLNYNVAVVNISHYPGF